MAEPILSNPRSAQEHGHWLPNRMFDSAANPFAVQNLLRKEEEKFSDTAQARARANFVADSTGREHADALARAFKPDRHGKPEPEAEPMPQAVAKPCCRDKLIAFRATTIKLGPGLTAPTAKAAEIANTDQIASIDNNSTLKGSLR